MQVTAPRVGGSLETGTDMMYWRVQWRATPNGNIAVPVQRKTDSP